MTLIKLASPDAQSGCQASLMKFLQPYKDFNPAKAGACKVVTSSSTSNPEV
jgi:hypothetical protein